MKPSQRDDSPRSDQTPSEPPQNRADQKDSDSTRSASASSARVSFTPEAFRQIVGDRDRNLRSIESAFNLRLSARDGDIDLVGESADVNNGVAFLEQLRDLVDRGHPLRPRDLELASRFFRDSPQVPLARHFLESGVGGRGQRRVRPRTARQGDYLDAIANHDVVFAVGPAGTGKTYLAVAMACEALIAKRVRRLILCRPAVEAGERLGFLPGDLAQKVNPYLRPLYDALFDMLPAERARDMLEEGTVEVAPLAFMRGRTLNEAFIILDEAQNTTSEQMKMFLTRIGEGSTAVVTGDVTQIDLPPGRTSGLVHAEQVVLGVKGTSFIHFEDRDVVRHNLVQRIVRAYDKFNRQVQADAEDES